MPITNGHLVAFCGGSGTYKSYSLCYIPCFAFYLVTRVTLPLSKMFDGFILDSYRVSRRGGCLSPEMPDFNLKRAEVTQSGSKVNSRRSHILESIGSDASGSDPGGDLPSGDEFVGKRDDGVSSSKSSDVSLESATSNVSDWPWS